MKWFAALAGALLLATSGCASYDDWGGGYGSIYGGYPAYPVGGIGMDVGAISDFYGPLSPYGSWFSDPLYGMVFQPYGLGAGWMPYSLGYWMDTPRYGRMWHSDEPFGWATYHYGRWTQDAKRGWFWVPGTKFTPGAVRWSNNGSRVGWEALAPRRGSSNRVQRSTNGWIYAPRARLGSPDLARYTSRGSAAGPQGWTVRTTRPAERQPANRGRNPGVVAQQTPPQRTAPQASWRRNGAGITFERNEALSDRLPDRRQQTRRRQMQESSGERAAPVYRSAPRESWSSPRSNARGGWSAGGNRGGAWGGGGRRR